jgi:CubicO group peptidase (beta-lactamase class C family)
MNTNIRKLALALLLVADCFAQTHLDVKAVESYLSPYVQSNNFSGDVLIEQNGKIVFEKNYGFASREKQIRNTDKTQFHIASMSMQFTAAAVLRLVDTGSLSFDEHVGEVIGDVSGGDKITIRDLLTERSGLTDINSLPDYNDLLTNHQTPANLVDKIKNRPLLFEPGSKYLHEEHSAYNLLALIVEKRTGLPFAAAVKKLVFDPAGLSRSLIDDDSPSPSSQMAEGYEPVELEELKPAGSIHWSAKTGNASVGTTVRDEARWTHMLFNGQFLKKDSQDAILNAPDGIGYGWFRSLNERYHETIYYMNGRSPGFSSFVVYLPREQTTVVLFGNIYSSATTPMGYDLAAIALHLPYQSFQPSKALSAQQVQACTGTFHFGADFYQPNAIVTLVADGTKLSLRWPSGSTSSLIPLSADRFMDRSYWVEIGFERDESGSPKAIVYGKFRGTREQ